MKKVTYVCDICGIEVRRVEYEVTIDVSEIDTGRLKDRFRLVRADADADLCMDCLVRELRRERFVVGIWPGEGGDTMTLGELEQAQMAIMQLDLLPVVDTYTAAVVQPVPSTRPTYGKPGICKRCGKEAYDIYQYSDSEYKRCYVAHHDRANLCIEREWRHPHQHVPMRMRYGEPPHPWKHEYPGGYGYA